MNKWILSNIHWIFSIKDKYKLPFLRRNRKISRFQFEVVSLPDSWMCVCSSSSPTKTTATTTTIAILFVPSLSNSARRRRRRRREGTLTTGGSLNSVPGVLLSRTSFTAEREHQAKPCRMCVRACVHVCKRERERGGGERKQTPSHLHFTRENTVYGPGQSSRPPQLGSNYTLISRFRHNQRTWHQERSGLSSYSYARSPFRFVSSRFFARKSHLLAPLYAANLTIRAWHATHVTPRASFLHEYHSQIIPRKSRKRFFNFRKRLYHQKKKNHRPPSPTFNFIDFQTTVDFESICSSVVNLHYLFKNYLVILKIIVCKNDKKPSNFYYNCNTNFYETFATIYAFKKLCITCTP